MRFANPRVSIYLQPDCSSLLTPLQVFSYSEFLRVGETVTTRVITTTATNGGAIVAYPVQGYKFGSPITSTGSLLAASTATSSIAETSTRTIRTGATSGAVRSSTDSAIAILIYTIAIVGSFAVGALIVFCRLKRRKGKRSKRKKAKEDLENLHLKESGSKAELDATPKIPCDDYEIAETEEMRTPVEVAELASKTSLLNVDTREVPELSEISEVDNGNDVR
jgi:hypothetical protein